MRVSTLLARAKACINKGCKYGLGAGVTSPQALWPWNERFECDCSAFACWCLRISKAQEFKWLRDVNGGWYNTDGIWWDAIKEKTGFFEQVKTPEPGCLVVYPGKMLSQAEPRIGHVGIVSGFMAADKLSIIHCSMGNFNRHGDAIQETEDTAFREVPFSIYAWAANLERDDG